MTTTRLKPTRTTSTFTHLPPREIMSALNLSYQDPAGHLSKASMDTAGYMSKESMDTASYVDGCEVEIVDEECESKSIINRWICEGDVCRMTSNPTKTEKRAAILEALSPRGRGNGKGPARLMRFGSLQCVGPSEQMSQPMTENKFLKLFRQRKHRS